MDNNLNNNTDKNVNVEAVQPVVNTTANVQPIVSPATNIVTGGNSSIVNTPAVTTSNVVGATASTNTVSTETVPQPVNVVNPNVSTGMVNKPNTTNMSNAKTNNQNINSNNDQGYYKKFFIMMGIIVGGVLLIAAILLYFLLNGTIENRNRLTCTKTIQGDGYLEHIKRYYTFDDRIMQRVYLTHTFTHDELTDDMYNQIYDEIINNDEHFIAKYGFETKITKTNNVVTISSYDVNYYGDDVNSIKNKNDAEGYTCK